MKDAALLAYKSERAASRKLAQRLGISNDEALLRTLTVAAGPLGIDALLAQRRALLDADAARRQARAERQALAAEKRRNPDASNSPWCAWFDGSARPNPGRCTIGGVLLGPGGTRIELSQDAGHGNSGEAEYRALIAVLEAAVTAGADGLTVYGDSKVVIDDVTGPAHAAAPSLAPLRARASELLARCGQTQVRWIPRHRNPEADALSQRAAAA
ncbi:MAG TPA: ribonuclease HI family protein [Telluria sp.]|nr:ribonuclease HI family protein [Telluria sp.]